MILSQISFSQEEIDMNWKINTFLPNIVQENFTVRNKMHIITMISDIFLTFLCLKKALLAGYLGSIDEYAKSYNLKVANKSSQTEDPGETVAVFTQNLVSGELTEQLMRYVLLNQYNHMLVRRFWLTNDFKIESLTQKIYKKLTDEDFPEQFGCRYKLRCPALEFVKYICKILSLDKNIQNQVLKLKKDLLKIVNVREFSDEAQYLDPSLSFVIPQVILSKKKKNFFKILF